LRRERKPHKGARRINYKRMTIFSCKEKEGTGKELRLCSSEEGIISAGNKKRSTLRGKREASAAVLGNEKKGLTKALVFKTGGR